jgi:triphosphoribosyl-dephospho-CoA synthase
MVAQTHYYYERVGDTLSITPCLFTADGLQVCELIGRAALNSLYQELCAYPKPGLVSFIDSGSHQDMDASTLVNSLFSLQNYFRDAALVGMRNTGFDQLRHLGLDAESRMLRATRNINTHRGAIFTMGLMSAAAGFLVGRRRPMDGDILGHVVREHWGKDILLSVPRRPCSHGTLVNLRYGVPGVRQEAAAGFPHVFNSGLPTLRESLCKGADFLSAVIETFFSLMAVTPDNNLLFRGGEEGLLYAQRAARSFLNEGGIYQQNWQAKACAVHHELIARNLSPGGSADLLALTLFVHRLQTPSLRPPSQGWRSLVDGDSRPILGQGDRL